MLRTQECAKKDVKKRWANHTRSFRDPKLRNVTSIANLVHRLKENNTAYNITWKILKRARSYSGGGANCKLCIEEAYLILMSRGLLINKHKESLINCLHRRANNFDNFRPI